MIVELFLDGEDTRKKPLKERRLSLGGTISKHPAILVREEFAFAVAHVQDSVAHLPTIDRIIAYCEARKAFAKADPFVQAGAPWKVSPMIAEARRNELQLSWMMWLSGGQLPRQP